MYNIYNYYTVMNLFDLPWWLTGKKSARLEGPGLIPG